MEGYLSLGVPLAIAPSLDTIPGSVTGTPCLRDPDEPPSPPPPPPVLSVEAGPSDLTSCHDGSRRSSISSAPISGSYFPAPATSSPSDFAYLITQEPDIRSQPSPITLSTDVSDEPLSSSYPDQGMTQERSRGEQRTFTFPLKPALSLDSQRSSTHREDSEGSSTEDHLPVFGSLSRESSDSSKSSDKPRYARRRASTISHAFPAIQSRRSSLTFAVPPIRLPKFSRRRASISNAPAEAEYQDGALPHWPSMPSQEARRISPRTSEIPFSYQQPDDSEYTLESVSTVATVRPLAISPRASSLTAALQAHVQNGGKIVLGFSHVSSPSQQSIEVMVPDDLIMPHNPPPRRSSLDYGSQFILENRPTQNSDGVPQTALRNDVRSVLSASLTGTETSISVDTNFPSPSSNHHPLSSATTSLSRSAKSGKEGDDVDDTGITSLRLQRSLEWEARQTRHRTRLEKGRMILLELVETEVAYAQDLKTLVQVYLPQLYAMPLVSERTADLIGRNSAELLNFHSQLAVKMVNVLKEEGLRYEVKLEPFMSSRLERASRRLAAFFVNEVSHNHLEIGLKSGGRLRYL